MPGSVSPLGVREGLCEEVVFENKGHDRGSLRKRVY